MDEKSPNARGRGRSPSLAALLSFLWPGLGQFYLRDRRLAAILALPSLGVALLLAYQLRRGPIVLAAQLLADRNLGLGVIAILVLFGAWRLVAVALAFRAGERSSNRNCQIAERVAIGALAAVIVATHLGGGYLLLTYSNAGEQVFGSPDPSFVDLTTPSPGPGATPTPLMPSSPSPIGTPSINSRVTILFTGVDSSAGRSEVLYDSIMVVSYDPKTNSVQMVSVPRDSASFPMYYGNHPVVSVTTRINSVPTYVHNGWIQSPDSPYMTLVNEVSYLVGIPINYYAVMNLDGFVAMINLVGGIDIDNPSAIDDPSYATPVGTVIGYHLAAGPQHLDGDQALGYVRSRHGANNSDWARSSRQQQVLVALLHQMAQPSEILALPGVVSALGSSINTNFPANQVADYVAAGQNVPSQNITQVVLGPPTYTLTDVNNVNGASTTCLINARVAALSIQLFGKDSTWYGKPAPANTCPPQS